jgi:hypothetical protein
MTSWSSLAQDYQHALGEDGGRIPRRRSRTGAS